MENRETPKSAGRRSEAFEDFYANVVACNVTPFELNLIFGRAAVPLEFPIGEQVKLEENVEYFARVALPVNLLPAITKLLNMQLEFSKQQGYLDEKVLEKVRSAAEKVKVAPEKVKAGR